MKFIDNILIPTSHFMVFLYCWKKSCLSEKWCSWPPRKHRSHDAPDTILYFAPKHLTHTFKPLRLKLVLHDVTVCETSLATRCETGLAKGVTRCNVSDTNSQPLRKVETFQLLVKPVSQRQSTQV